MKYIVCLFMLITILKTVFGDCDHQIVESERHKLTNQLFNCGYDSTIIPVKDHKTAVNVSFNMIVKFIKYDHQSGTLGLDSWLSIHWYDEYLKWNPQDFGNLREIKVTTDNIWVPDLSVYNRFDQGTEPTVFASTKCIVNFNGLIVCVHPHHVDALCQADMSKYPFDSQNCTITFGSWVHKGEEVNILHHNPIADTEDLETDGEWALKKVGVHRNPGHYDFHPNSTYPSIEVSFEIKRMHGSHSATVLIPSIVIFMLVITSMWVPPDSNERMVLCCVNLITEFFHLEYISFMIPMKGNKIPQLMVLGRDSLLLCGFSIVFTIILKNIVLKKTPPPSWISRIVSFVIGCRPGQIIFLDDTTLKGVAFAKGEDDGSTIIDNSENSVNTGSQDWRVFAKILDRLIFISYVIVFTVMMVGFIP
ncbi:unnamed protein product [Brassicogethes aeneus]|uniref:Neurotransmitter-gated ion-channel ligand-binding domain-containing protein n=1 Tax=Brassicogethes aeneus TaxID=1431903 RepID=A0A9P0AX17_BRAAE|nr:unnamed protein product [Brassicogethes aeneus]